MNRGLLLASLFILPVSQIGVSQTPAPPVSKIKPGEVVVPVGMGEQRLIFGELIALDAKTRTGSFRNENNDETTPFTILPYSELHHHAAQADVQDFHHGERCLFRLHRDTEGKWTWLTYIGDEMDFLKNHSSYIWVDAIDPAKKQITISRGNADKTQMGEKGVLLQTTADTRYWKDGKAAAFADIKVGDKLRTATRGTGKGKDRVCLDVFLDEASFQKLQDEQKAVHLKRIEADGVLAYVDTHDGKKLTLTLFQEGKEWFKGDMAAGQKVRIAPAGVDRKANGPETTGTITEVKKLVKKVCPVVITLDGDAPNLTPKALVKVWVEMKK